MTDKLKVYVLTLFFLIAFPSFEIWAQELSEATDEVWYLNQPISTFEFKGLDSISRVDMNNVLSEYKGKPFTLVLLSEIQALLYELEYFDEIIPEAQRGQNDALVLVLSVVERATISKITFEGNKVLGNASLQSVLSLRRGDIFNSFKANNDSNSVKERYFSQGYPEATVSYEVLPDENSRKKQVIVAFLVNENARITVSEITFTGNNVFRAGKLKRTIKTKRKSIANKGAFSEDRLEQDKALIAQEYYKKGYIDAQVIDVLIDRQRDDNVSSGSEVFLTYVIQEGQRYAFSGVSFSGNTIYSDEELSQLFPIKEGDILDLTKFQRGYDGLRLKYADQGFIFNTFDYEEIRDEETQNISFLITVKELGQSHVENILIDGNVRTKDYVIYRALGIQEGDVFSASNLNYARLNLMRLQYFTSVVPDSRPGSAPGLIDLIFKVEESRTRDIRFGATFGGSVDFPLSLFARWSQPNFLGRGLTLAVSGTASPLEQSVSTSFNNPYLFNSPFSFYVSLVFAHELVNNVPQDIIGPFFDANEDTINYDPYTGEYVFASSTTIGGVSYSAGDPFPGNPSSDDISNYGLIRDYEFFGANLNSIYNNSLMSYDNYRISFLVGTGYVYRSPVGRLGGTVRIGPSLNYVYYDKTTYRPADITLRENLENWKVSNGITFKGYFDSRDNPTIPANGIYMSQEFTLYGGLLFGDTHYIKSTSVGEGHITFFDWPVLSNWSWKLVGAGQTVFTVLLPQFYYPGDTNYEENGPSYTQRLALNGVYNARGWPLVRNGEATWNTWFELRMPLFEQVLWWDQFIEMGRLWVSREAISNEEFDVTQLLFTMGTGFRFVVQSFPIRIYLAKRFSLNSDYSVNWQTGNLAGTDAAEGSGLDLVFTIGIDF